MTITQHEVAALAHPALSRILELQRRGGWQWVPVEARDGGLMLRGIRTWPGSDVADAVLVIDETNAHANRTTERGVTWLRSGTVADVVDGLLELPAPHDPLAPTRVLGVRVPGPADL